RVLASSLALVLACLVSFLAGLVSDALIRVTFASGCYGDFATFQLVSKIKSLLRQTVKTYYISQMPKRQAVLKLHYMSIFIFSAGLVVLVLIGGFFAWRLARAYRQFTVKMNLTSATLLADLPSVSVCIPARNETHAMTECLERVIASNYPKIEIIVLDDSSVDDTSVLIKSFAHSGVRFVEGSPLPDGWLGKNHALEGLLKEASGRYVFFMDVDTKISPFTISQLVAYAASEDATMVSVLPRRNDGWRMSVIWTTLRYFWEIIFHTPA